MARQSAARAATAALAAGFLLISSCSPDSTSIQRLPFEPEAAPAKVTISPRGTSLGYIGAQFKLNASVARSGESTSSNVRFAWSSSDPGVVTVAQDGTLTAIKEGTARISARVVNISDAVTVTVKRVAATVALSDSSVLFTELGATAAVSATVLDGGGQTLSSDQVTWSAADPSVATVSATGTITAVGQGSTSVKATSGAVQASVSVQVATGPADIEVSPPTVSMDAIGDQVQLSAAVLDAAGDTLPAVAIIYRWGNQSIADVDTLTGLVTATGVGNTTVSITGDTVVVNVPVSVTQTPAAITVSPDGTTLVPGGTLSFSADVDDRNANDIVNPQLSWSSTDEAVATINSSGLATGVAAGSTMIVGTAGPVADTVTLLVVDVPVDSVAVSPDSVVIDLAATTQLTASFFDDQGTPLVGPTATWSSDDAGIASVNTSGLVTGVGQGSTWIRATADNGSDSTYVTVNLVSFFDIEVRYSGTAPSAAVQAAFAAAEARWEELIVGNLTSGTAAVAEDACGITHPAVGETVDDLLIYAEVTAIDGSGGVLGQAGPCLVRSSNDLTILGVMQFDEDDLDDLLATNNLEETIIHEMGHVLGLGASTPWENTLVDKGGADPYWPGAEAVSQYDLAGGTAVNKVPVANTGGAGTQDAHWREAHMGRELMTGFINTGAVNPLSAISIGAMQDMGYQVDLSKADAYTVSALLRTSPDQLFELRELPRPRPLRVDRSGRVVR